MSSLSLVKAREIAQTYLRYMGRGERMSMDLSSDDAMQVCEAVLMLSRGSAAALVGNDDANDPSAREEDEQPCSKNTRCVLSDGHGEACRPLSGSAILQDARPTENGEARDMHVYISDRMRERLERASEGDSLCGTQTRSANSTQVGGSHYGLTDYQHWDMVIEFGLDYFQGQITKYVMRWNKKNGVQDLEKAKHFLQKYIDEINAGTVKRA